MTAARALCRRCWWTSAITLVYVVSSCMVRGAPRMCMSTMPALCSAASSSMPISEAAVTSLTRSAPAARASAATATFEVSTEMTDSGHRRRISVITGITRCFSSLAATGAAPGRVDSPPTSTIVAPSSIRSSAWRTASSKEKLRPPSEKESGVQLRTPITTGRARGHRLSRRPGRVDASAFRSCALDGGWQVAPISKFLSLNS